MPPRRNQTLRPRWFHILLALSDQDRHGSDIVREVLDQTGGELRLWPSMLYRSLEHMEDEELIVELKDSGSRPPGASGKWRYFRITNRGRQLLAQEADRLAKLADVARAKIVLARQQSS